MERVGHSSGSGYAEGDRVGSGRGHVDGVFEPLSGSRPSEVVAPARVGGHFQVDAIGAVAVTRSIDRSNVIGNPLATGVVIFRLHRAGNGCGSAAVWTLAAGCLRGGLSLRRGCRCAVRVNRFDLVVVGGRSREAGVGITYARYTACDQVARARSESAGGAAVDAVGDPTVGRRGNRCPVQADGA